MLIPDEEFKQLIIKNTLVDEKGLEDLVEYSKNAEITLADALLDKNIITDERLGQMIAEYIKVPYIALSKLTIPENVLHIVPEKTARKQRIIPFARDASGIKVAMANPNNTEILKLIQQKTGETVIPHFATEREIVGALHVYKKNLQKTLDRLLQEALDRSGGVSLNDAPIAKMVDLLVEFAYQQKTSDIHIEVEEKNSLVRFRIDGVLHDVLFLPKQLHDRIITRIKVMSRLRTDEHLSAQDGKMRVVLDEENLDIRVSILPVSEGEKACLRLLATRQKSISLLDLGMAEDDLAKIQKAMTRSFGMILSTGPTGAGKSTSIYSILKILNTREKNITTIEDPVEYRIKGVNQIPVNAKTGLTFAAGLRAILRQDPNIIFVGEIRDNETAGIAVNAALTGHLVVSTLHTNSAAGALPRLTDMKVEPFLVASTVNVIIAQRLIRKICDKCKASVTLNAADLAQNIGPDILKKNFGVKKEIIVYKGKGCEVCHFTGYEGRIGIFEVLEVTKNVKELIAAKKDSDVIEKAAVDNGMRTMLEDGLLKVSKGLTTIEEVLRVTKVEMV
jgi:type IV pilus assembly protein PilB